MHTTLPIPICPTPERECLSLSFSRRAQADPGSQEVVSRSRPPFPFASRENSANALLHHLHRVLDRGFGRDGHWLMDHDVFCGQSRTILVGFQRAEHIEFAENPMNSFRSSTTGAPDIWVVSHSSATTIPFWPTWRIRVLVPLICPLFESLRLEPLVVRTLWPYSLPSTSHAPFSASCLMVGG